MLGHIGKHGGGGRVCSCLLGGFPSWVERGREFTPESLGIGSLYGCLVQGPIGVPRLKEPKPKYNDGIPYSGPSILFFQAHGQYALKLKAQ